MREALTFLLTAGALLAAPGPTNALLTAAGATVGTRRAIPLVVASLAGYALSIALLAALLGPVVRTSPHAALALRVACGSWLVLNAVTLWRSGREAATGAALVAPWRVLVTTLLNPKGAVLTFAVLPHLSAGRYREALPWCAALAAVIAASGALWVSVGALARARRRGAGDGRLVARLSAGVVAAFAVAVLRG